MRCVGEAHECSIHDYGYIPSLFGPGSSLKAGSSCTWHSSPVFCGISHLLIWLVWYTVWSYNVSFVKKWLMNCTNWYMWVCPVCYMYIQYNYHKFVINVFGEHNMAVPMCIIFQKNRHVTQLLPLFILNSWSKSSHYIVLRDSIYTHNTDKLACFIILPHLLLTSL